MATAESDISDFERQTLRNLRRKLKLNVHDWNEVELAYNFIGPVLALVDYTTERFNLFAERPLSGIVNGIELGGKPDGVIASGFRQPETPYFCFHEYKKEQDPGGDAAAQALAAMLVAQELNEHHHPVYGCYVKGQDWCFMVLQDQQYAISPPYIATRDDVFDIFRILKALKQTIAEFVAEDSAT
ncbi:MAG: hypothetical protein GY801_15700, partial [bacterium]|nr:hypothetical protein [bacterium]